MKDILIVDQARLISPELLKHLNEGMDGTVRKVCVIGSPAQLPPIRDCIDIAPMDQSHHAPPSRGLTAPWIGGNKLPVELDGNLEQLLLRGGVLREVVTPGMFIGYPDVEIVPAKSSEPGTLTTELQRGSDRHNAAVAKRERRAAKLRKESK